MGFRPGTGGLDSGAEFVSEGWSDSDSETPRVDENGNKLPRSRSRSRQWRSGSRSGVGSRNNSYRDLHSFALSEDDRDDLLRDLGLGDVDKLGQNNADGNNSARLKTMSRKRQMQLFRSTNAQDVDPETLASVLGVDPALVTAMSAAERMDALRRVRARLGIDDQPAMLTYKQSLPSKPRDTTLKSINIGFEPAATLDRKQKRSKKKGRKQPKDDKPKPGALPGRMLKKDWRTGKFQEWQWLWAKIVSSALPVPAMVHCQTRRRLTPSFCVLKLFLTNSFAIAIA